jgi:hypothetical protein
MDETREFYKKVQKYEIQEQREITSQTRIEKNPHCYRHSSKNVDQTVTALKCFREVYGWNLGLVRDYPSCGFRLFPQPLHAKDGIVHQIGPFNFMSNSILADYLNIKHYTVSALNKEILPSSACKGSEVRPVSFSVGTGALSLGGKVTVT